MMRTPLRSPSSVYGSRVLADNLLVEVATAQIYGASVAVVDPELPGGSATCGIGYPTDKTFLLGSVGKAFNGLIYSEMVTEGIVRPQDTLDQFLSLDDTAAGRATLESLVTHTSGLPVIGGGRRSTLRANWRMLRSRDPQPETLDDLKAQLRAAPAIPGRFSYSNLGGAALGHALAAAEGTTYPDLISARIAEPLRCSGLYVPSPGESEHPGDAHGLSVHNTAQEPWTGEGYAPAGGIRASAEDMVRVLISLLHTPLPGWREAFAPLFRVDPESFVGAGWFIKNTTATTNELVWHNGVAGGFGSVVVLDLATRRGVFISIIDGTMQADPVPAARTLLHSRP